MPNILTRGLWGDKKTLGNKAVDVAFYFTTDGSGDVDTVYPNNGFNGLITVTRGSASGETNYYTVTYGGTWGSTMGVFVDHGTARTLTKVVDPTAKTVEIQFSDTMLSARIDVKLEATATSLG